ncbi:hypothetical protein [Embleya sp. AB8]|uniref:hypothetical protein n=1 Tax=Embleya sp. AB8 TaxID=3156304 RepID=UPI003C79366D
MSVQPDHAPPTNVACTIRGVREALDPDQRAQFERELADAALGDIANLVLLWWGIVTMGNDPDVIADLNAAAEGRLRTWTADEVFGDEASGWNGRTTR